ncbi:LytTR family transcriptional regulator DNA-binding domain-containing protein [uncultured Maricaulis sp.]|uniref:LytTR family DNA-binding domain-containing protein n=1 Tax=uncultured Maricaulis sp. TaxID=174710 RepID=UPI0030D9ABB0|tara:strand:+ start:44929 stop:45756 length:828 start_codon:yes stop_codon:yes gene_type:complete
MKPHRSYLPRYGTWPFELGLMLAVGVFFSVTGVYGTEQAPAGLRYIYWGVVMVAGGIVVILAETLYARHAPAAVQGYWISLGVVTLLATLPQGVIVAMVEAALFGARNDVTGVTRFPAAWINVGFIVLPMAALLRLLRLALAPDVVAVAADPGPVQSDPVEPVSLADRSPPAGLGEKLPAGLRQAELLALQAEDHYVRIHTSAGSDLVLIRFADAMKLVSDRAGYRLHRSWWVAAGSLCGASFSRGSGEAEIVGGLKAPISRTYAPQLRRAGLLP